MLKTRALTAVILLAAFLAALFSLSATGWAAFTALVVAVAAWEWGALLRWQAPGRIMLGVAAIFFCDAAVMLVPEALGLVGDFSASLAWQFGRWLYLPAALFWLGVVPIWLTRRWPLPGGIVGVLVGALVIFPTWLALLHLRQGGGVFVLAIMALVWVADIAAYFSGRTFGRHKLAPAISPGKTWEGAVGAAVGVVVYGLGVLDYLPPSLRTHLPVLIAVLLALTAVSIVGDLFESLLKRHAGLKDSSNVLPGHGGVLDRIDSLTSTLPLVALVWLASAL
ncbi:phosphatidate cytidylyltransferase [Rhodocyclus tenuis]|uniref:phosphatidate cytidylyltransferase n=1 Tax=Rhodocyclus gracilis TaxID=2929842 RepID=UPI001298AD2F|nr:phosphatidate cytidylyltransferase [Rhodocyclus gracilis]MRD71693.1 phosphatidate cytidylyltransferase [Rhodocyclus gracilis]